jgi:hypothetical protein
VKATAAPGERAGPAAEAAAAAAAGRDVKAVAEGQSKEAAVEVESWLPAEAGHDEKQTWAGLDCSGTERRGMVCRTDLGSSRGGRAARWRAELANHGPTCSRTSSIAA